jgi:hypothetical protein
VNTEQAAAESEQDRRDHRRLAGDVAELLAHEDAMRVPIAVRRLVDAGVEPIVVAKTLAIGDRDGGLMYRLSTRAGAFALAEHEAIAVDWISLAIRDADPDTAADVMVSGATSSCARRRSGRNALKSEAPRRVDRSRPCGFDRNRWFRSIGSWRRQCLGTVGEAARSSATCTITACALVYAAGW